MEGMQPDECTPEVGWEVRWPSPHMPGGLTVVPRRDQGMAIILATAQRNAGHKVKLYRVEKTEIDF